jgi:hypothetical protein
MLFMTVAKPVGEDLKTFDPAIDQFVASQSAFLENPESSRIKIIPDGNVIWFTFVAPVPGCPLSWRNLVNQCLEWAIDPNKLVFPYGNSKLIGQPWAMMLV